MKKIMLGTLIAVICIVGGFAAYITVSFNSMSEVSKGEPIPAYISEKAALLVIDVQEGLIGSLASSNTKGMTAQSDGLISSINKAVDWADANKIPVVYIRQESTDKIYNALTGGSTAKGSAASQIDKRVKVMGSNIFGKQKMDAFWNPELDSFLRSMKVNKLYITGLDAAFCVDRTIKGALARGYKVVAVKDALISGTPEKRDNMIIKYSAEGVSIITSGDLKGKKK